MRLARICRSSRAAVLETCRNRAVEAGFNPLEAYEPWRPVEWTIGLLDGIHSLGIPYLPAIGMAAWLLRAATLPMNVQSLEVMHKRASIAPAVQPLHSPQPCRF